MPGRRGLFQLGFRGKQGVVRSGSLRRKKQDSGRQKGKESFHKRKDNDKLSQFYAWHKIR